MVTFRKKTFRKPCTGVKPQVKAIILSILKHCIQNDYPSGSVGNRRPDPGRYCVPGTR